MAFKPSPSEPISYRKQLHDHENLLFTAARKAETRRVTEAHRSPQRLEEPLDRENKQPRSSSRTPKHKELFLTTNNNARFATEEEKEPLGGHVSGENAFIATQNVHNSQSVQKSKPQSPSIKRTNKLLTGNNAYSTHQMQRNKTERALLSPAKRLDLHHLGVVGPELPGEEDSGEREEAAAAPETTDRGRWAEFRSIERLAS